MSNFWGEEGFPEGREVEKVDSGGFFGMANFKWTMNPVTALVPLERTTLTPRAGTQIQELGSGVWATTDRMTLVNGLKLDKWMYEHHYLFLAKLVQNQDITISISIKPMVIRKFLDIFIFSESDPFLVFFLPTDSEIIPPDCLRPRSFTAIRRPSLRRDTEDTRLSVSLCDLNLQEETFHVTATTCPIPQNSLNSQHSHLLPSQLESDLRFHHLRGPHVKILDDQTVARLEHAREERTLVFTSRPLRINETIFVKINKSNAVRTGTLSYGVTSCDPSTLRPSDLPYNPESLVDRKEFWAICRVVVPLQSGDILGFTMNSDGELHLSHNGAGIGIQLCADCSQPLWMFFVLHGAIMQIRLLGSTILAERLGLSTPSSPTSTPNSPTVLCSGVSGPLLSTCGSGPLCSSISGTAPNSPSSLPESPIFSSVSGPWVDECTICYENMVDTVIYSCGHMCLCYSCGLKLKKMANACCPICRRAIKDIIKTYRST
ncbi:E3 ubiquitin-protein ligase NEURL1-like protein [Pitangus sulphuratus]|nr:E3 ubiquitin-protein ligase NEURL1-like protein [Pitangus sulphuratus]